jgi:hypothetical protein
MAGIADAPVNRNRIIFSNSFSNMDSISLFVFIGGFMFFLLFMVSNSYDNGISYNERKSLSFNFSLSPLL